MSNPNQFPNLQFSVNNRFLGLGAPVVPGAPAGGEANLSYEQMSNANSAEALFLLKQFLTNNGWTVTLSGCGWSTTDFINVTGDFFASGRLFNLPMIYFVLQDPSATRQLLFYRSPIGSAVSLINDPFAMTSKYFLTYSDKDFGTFPSQPTLVPIVSCLTSVHYTGVTSSVSGSTVTLSNVYVYSPVQNTYLSPSMVGQYITLVPPTGSTNPLSSYYLPTAQIQSVSKDSSGNYTIVTITDPSGINYNSNPAMGFYITTTGAMIGNFAHIDSTLLGGRVAVVSGLHNMTSNSIGHTLKITSPGSTPGSNDGEYLIINVVDSSHVQIISNDGMVFSTSESNNGQYFWRENFQAIDYVSCSQDRISIAYSAASKFTALQSLTLTSPAITWTVPIANDMVWITPAEQTLTPFTYPPAGTGNYFCQSQNKKIQQSTYWNVHMCCSTTAPYPFYFWVNYRESNVQAYLNAQKTQAFNPGSATNANVPLDGTIAYIYDSLSFIAMDCVTDNPVQDIDPVVFWADFSGGAPSYKESNSYAATLSSINELLPPGSVTASPIRSMRSWYKKPASFASQEDFLFQFNTMACGFLPTAVLLYQAIQPFSNGNSANCVTLIPGNLSTNLWSGNDEIYPLMYARGSIFYPDVYNQNTNQDAVLKEPFKLPVSYKGVSQFIKIAGMTRNQFDTLNDSGLPKQWIYAGRYPVVVLPWDGSSLPNEE